MKQLLILLFAVVITSAQSISLSIKNEKSSYAVGDTFSSAVTITIPEGFHLYANPLGPGIGKPLSVKVSHTDQIKWIDGFSNQPVKFNQDETDWVWQWDNFATIIVRGVVVSSSKKSAPFSLSVDGLICKESCIPQNKTIAGSISVGSGGDFISSSMASFSKLNRVTFPITITGTSPKLTTSVAVVPTKPAETKPLVSDTIDTISSQKPIDSVQLVASIDTVVQEKQAAVSAKTYSPREASSVLSGSGKSQDFTFALAIVFALIAGFILNFMPCVLPVLGIKILAFSEGKTGSKATAFRNSMAFASGMILVFMILATLAAFAGMSWGEQFQNPAFIVVMVVVMFLFGLGMFDLFIILVPASISNLGAKTHRSSLIDNFSKGVFATILATPCSGPFLGATLAWTVTQPKLTIYAVFLALGIGMASPYIILSVSRRLSRMIPKPGAWMEDFKRLLGFGLFGFAVYLMIGLPQDLVVPTISFVTFLAATLILYSRISPFGSSILRKTIAIVVSAIVLVSGYFVSFETVRSAVTKEQTAEWKPFTKELLAQAESDKRMVLLDFTAVWCMNCQFNKKSVYHTTEMDSVIAANNILAMTADLTVSNPELEQLRSALGSESIPFLVLFPADDPSNPIIFRDIVRKDQLFEVIKKVGK